MNIWMIIVGAGLITFVMRLSFIYLHGKTSFPAWFHRSLRYVPVAVVAAIVLPGIAMQSGVLDVSLNNPRLLAGIIAGLVAWWTGNAIAVLVVGMSALWVLQIWV
ncbi:MAG TPA: AzlD domain-containing protein [Burkholderiales bacterium]|jgi:branched-subunit amino acid transport protein|nr:AzlD domain-containing protein [Burkholderiales bacterium]